VLPDELDELPPAVSVPGAVGEPLPSQAAVVAARTSDAAIIHRLIDQAGMSGFSFGGIGRTPQLFSNAHTITLGGRHLGAKQAETCPN